MSEKPENPYDMNSSSFDADKYLQKLLKVSYKSILIRLNFNFSLCKFRVVI